MNFLKKSLTLFWIITSFCSCNGQNTPVNIKPLYPYQQEVVTGDLPDSTNRMNFKNRFYYLENYKGYAKDSIVFDNFVKSKIDSDYKKYNSYTFIFFEKSSFLNENTKDSLKNFVDMKRFAEQKPVLVYYWDKGNFEACKDYSKDKSGKSYQCGDGKGIFNSSVIKDSPSTVEVKVTLE